MQSYVMIACRCSGPSDGGSKNRKDRLKLVEDQQMISASLPNKAALKMASSVELDTLCREEAFMVGSRALVRGCKA